MSLVDQVKAEVAVVSVERSSSADFVRLSTFYEEMKRLGFSKKHEYELPMMDTVGRSIYSKSVGIKARP